MPCYHPLLLHYDGINSDTGKPNYKFTGVSMNRGFLSDRDRSGYDPRDVLIPCRRCIGCKLDYSRQWADRLMLELDHSKTALFLTLTYDEDHVTPAMYDEELGRFWYTLVKKDLQDFNKRLRDHFDYKPIRFFAVGEYGATLRPHFHGIYFGLSLSDFPDLKFRKFNKSHQPLYHSKKLDKIWRNGDVTVGNVSWQACAYVARYSLKKQGPNGDLLALSRNCLPEFSLMSRKPGIAGYFAEDHPEIFDNPRDKLFISDPYGIKHVNEVNMPKFIFNKLELINPELFAMIKEERAQAAEDRYFAELLKTDLDEFEYMNVKELSHIKGFNSLVRPLE